MVDRRTMLLAHSLGLGKTVTSIAAVEELIDKGDVAGVLVICPASVKWQWKRQIDKFTDGALVIVIEGDRIHRRNQYRAVKRGEAEYVLMNYEQVVNDWGLVRFLGFDAVVADEVQAIKHPEAKRTRFVRRINPKYKFGLTGQPMENRPEEAFGIMEWIDKDVLGPSHIFDRTFIVRKKSGSVQKYKNLNLFRDLMAESMHRKTHADVADQLPAVIEESFLVEMDPKTQRLYDTIARELVGAIKEAGFGFRAFDVWGHYTGDSDQFSSYGEIMPRIMALQMLCDHPKLLMLSAENFDAPETKAGSKYAAELRDRGLLEGLTSAPKLQVTLEEINGLLEADAANKIVLFSFFKPMLRIISDKMKYEHVVFTGDLSARERDAAIQQFQEDPGCRAFLSSDAGGVGVDLPAANYLVSYDLPFSAGKWEQRNGRIIRLSSEWPHVTLLSMLMKNSIEEWKYEGLETKSQVASAWLDGKGVAADGSFAMTAGGLLDFLEEQLRPGHRTR